MHRLAHRQLSFGSRVAITAVGLLVSVGFVVALFARAWLDAIELAAVASVCGFAVLTGTDPEDPDGIRTSGRLSRRARSTIDDQAL
jgi:hypothetical protein